MSRARAILIWLGLAAAIIVPLMAAAASPLLAWRDPIYIAAGFAGVIALALLLVQPLLVEGYLPGIPNRSGRRVHGTVGGILALTVLAHVAGLWITSLPDVIDALLFASPTPFSFWGVVAMWAVFGAALLAALRRRLKLRAQVWRRSHAVLVVLIVLGTVVHAMLIEGTMEIMSKTALCALVIAATISVISDLVVLARR